ncbi:MAG: GntR family transcriptional regulator [Clostridia bacterium]|nr:GntR family transcriptional regulator [Clostridia bacterium]
MKWKINSDYAIYPQVVDCFIKAIISGELEPGQRIPSIRDLAGDAAINPNTMQRALTELERRELIINQHTIGKLVTNDTNLVSSLKSEYAKEQVSEFITNMQEMGFSLPEIADIVNEETKRL